MRFIGKAAMARNKLASGRPKDVVDAQLLESASFRRSWGRLVDDSGTVSCHTPMAMRDTSEPALERYYELLRARTPLARITAAADLSSAVGSWWKRGSGLPIPTSSPRVVRARLARRLYGAEVAARLFPDVERNVG
jgi:hypothetical protein